MAFKSPEALKRVRKTETIGRLAQKAEMPVSHRVTYAAGWDRLPEVEPHKMPNFIKQHHHRHHETRHATVDEPLQHFESDAVGGHTHAVHAGNEENHLLQDAVKRHLSHLPQQRNLSHSTSCCYRGVGWGASRGSTINPTGCINNDHDRQRLKGRLHGIFRHNSELDRTALPWEKREWFEQPRTPTPPSVAELAEQRQLFFSTAKLPWLKTAAKVPKDSELEIVVKALTHALEDQMRGRPDHGFRMVTNEHRDKHNFQDLNPKITPNEVKTKRRVLIALERHPLGTVGELVGCDPDEWLKLSKMLGGLSHGVAVRKAMLLVSSPEVTSIQRGVFHAAASRNKQRTVDRGRMCI
jgi:hypothetical protein